MESGKSSKNNINKRFKKCIIVIGIILVVSEIVLHFSFGYHFGNTKKLPTYIDMNKGSIESFYNNITTSTIGEINSAIAILAVIATVFAAFGICISLINVDAFREIDERSAKIDKKMIEIDEKSAKMDEKSAKIDEKIDKIDKDIQNLKVMQHLVLGKMYENLTDNANYQKYAIKEYKEAGKLPNSSIITIQLINIYSDLFIKTNRERYLDAAKKYAEQKYEETNDIILGDLYFAKGCLYGLIAKRKGKLGHEDEKQDCLKKSKENFENAILKDKENYQFYSNLAVTCYHLSENQNIIDNLEDAKRYANNDKILYKQDIDVFNVFDADDMKEMGYKRWKDYKEQVEVPVENEYEFNKKIYNKRIHKE